MVFGPKVKPFYPRITWGQTTLSTFILTLVLLGDVSLPMKHVSRWQTGDREAIILIPILWRDVDMLNSHFCRRHTGYRAVCLHGRVLPALGNTVSI